MKINKRILIFPTLAIMLFCSFTPIPEPQQQDKNTLNLSEFSGTNNRISRGKLQVYKRVMAGFGEDFAFDGLKLKVTSYTFAYVPKNGQAYIENVKGNQITSNIRQHFLQAKPGDMIILSQVNVVGDGWKFNRIIEGPVLNVY
jgi:hypothetical protein